MFLYFCPDPTICLSLCLSPPPPLPHCAEQPGAMAAEKVTWGIFSGVCHAGRVSHCQGDFVSGWWWGVASCGATICFSSALWLDEIITRLIITRLFEFVLWCVCNRVGITTTNLCSLNLCLVLGGSVFPSSLFWVSFPHVKTQASLFNSVPLWHLNSGKSFVCT